MLTLSLLLCTSAVNDCQNYPTSIRAGSAKGSWSTKSHLCCDKSVHSNDTASLFLTKYRTNCGFYDLNGLSHSLQFRDEQGILCASILRTLYPFRVTIKRNYSNSNWNNDTVRITKTKVVHRHSANRLFKHYDHPSAHWQTSLLLIVVNKENFPM